MAVWTSLLETAIHSPSPHNVQPWRVRIISDTEADLLIDSARTLPKEDPTGSFIILTMGMFVESLRLLAAVHGYILDHSTYHEPSWYAAEFVKSSEQTFFPFARLKLTSSTTVSAELDPSLFLKRRTARISLTPDPVPEQIIEELKSLAQRWDQKFEWITDADSIKQVLAKNTEALFEDLNNPAYHDEIVEWFRFTDSSSLATRDGLDYRCMNTSRTAFWMSARMSWLLQTPVARTILAKVYRSQLGVVPTVGLLAGDFWPPETAFKTGSFLMRFWLEAAKHNLYIHPYGNLVTNKRAAHWLCEETGLEQIWLVFKIGYSGEPPKSHRRSVAEILID